MGFFYFRFQGPRLSCHWALPYPIELLPILVQAQRGRQGVSGGYAGGQDGRRRAADFCENHAFGKSPSNPPQDVGVRGMR